MIYYFLLCHHLFSVLHLSFVTFELPAWTLLIVLPFVIRSLKLILEPLRILIVLQLALSLSYCLSVIGEIQFVIILENGLYLLIAFAVLHFGRLDRVVVLVILHLLLSTSINTPCFSGAWLFWLESLVVRRVISRLLKVGLQSLLSG